MRDRLQNKRTFFLVAFRLFAMSLMTLCFAVGGVYGAEDLAREQKFLALLEEGEHLFEEEGKCAEAREKWLEASKIFPKDARPLLLSAESCDSEGAFDKALPFLMRAAKLEPKNVETRRKVAMEIYRVKSKSEGIEYLQKCIKEFPDDADLHDSLAYYLFLEKRYDEAEEMYEVLIGLTPESDFYPERLLECLVYQDKFEEAFSHLNDQIRAIEISEKSEERKTRDVEELEQKYRNLLERTGHSGAVMDFDLRRLAEDPGNPARLIRLADIHLSCGYGALALSDYLRAAYLSGEGDALIHRAKKLASEGRNSDALLFIQAALEHFSEHPEILDLIASIMSLPTGIESREVFNPRKAECARLAEKACGRIARGKAPLDIRLRAKLNAVYYHYQPLPRSMALGREAREKYVTILSEDGLSTETRQSVEKQIKSIDETWLNMEAVREKEEKP